MPHIHTTVAMKEALELHRPICKFYCHSAALLDSGYYLECNAQMTWEETALGDSSAPLCSYTYQFISIHCYYNVGGQQIT